MKKITKKRQMFLYAIGGMGVNMLNLMVSSYLCSAIIASGFNADVVANQTFLSRDLVIPAVWAVFGVIAKIIDGIIDVPMASFTDNLKTRFGRRRPALIIGLVPMILAYVVFTLITPNPDAATLLNTIFYGVTLCIFYSFYTLTMVTYYATFTEIVDTQEERNYISNVKSVCDIVYFILGYVVVRMLLNGMNIRVVSMIVLPIVLTMLIPLLLIKERSTKDGTVTREDGQVSKTVSLVKSIAYTFKNKSYIIWMVVYSFMTFGVQLFLSGINEYFSVSGMSMILVMMASFGPVPFTLLLYNRLTRTRGFGFSYRYVLIIFAVGMLSMFGVSLLPAGTAKTILSIVTGIISSFGIGAMFSVAYSVPSQLASEEEKKTGISNAAMYFAVQGLFAGVASGIGGQAVLTLLKTSDLVRFMTPVCAAAVMIAFALTFKLPESIREMGKK
ncbi:MAG: MFS transporter [Lachnospiraceae bacterium]|nr:MFS transporter [Lachnospiraceae bacterium]